MSVKAAVGTNRSFMEQGERRAVGRRWRCALGNPAWMQGIEEKFGNSGKKTGIIRVLCEREITRVVIWNRTETVSAEII